VQRIVTVSIIGCDRFSGGYGAAKVAHEEAALAGPLPAKILRAAQLHEFVEQLVEWGRQGHVSRVPKMRTQLVAARTVADALVQLADDASETARAPQIAGPREERLAEMAGLLVARRGDAVAIEEISNRADPDTEVFEAGGLLPDPHATLAGPTFADRLDETR
jgi:uncharacterized protein YbjT (DUF2867 family)